MRNRRPWFHGLLIALSEFLGRQPFVAQHREHSPSNTQTNDHNLLRSISKGDALKTSKVGTDPAGTGRTMESVWAHAWQVVTCAKSNQQNRQRRRHAPFHGSKDRSWRSLTLDRWIRLTAVSL